MKPTRLTLLLYVFLVGLGSLWTTRMERTWSPEGGYEDRTHIGPGAFVRVTTQLGTSRPARSVEVRWWRLGFLLLASYAAARAFAHLGEHAVRGTVPIARWLTIGACVTVSVAFVLATAWSRYYWGYFFSRPSPAEAIQGIAALDGISVVQCDLQSGIRRCEPASEGSVQQALTSCRTDPYYCLTGRVALGLSEAGLLSDNPPPVPLGALRQVEVALADDRVLVPSDPGYDGNNELHGAVAQGTLADGSPVLVAGLAGEQISNDHHPYYELRLSPAPLRIRASSVFFYDVAGIEGLEWPAAFIGCSIVGLTAWLPVGLVASIVAGQRRRRRTGTKADEGSADGLPHAPAEAERGPTD